MNEPLPHPELPLGFPGDPGADMPLLPARMVIEFVYCSRLAYLEWAQGEWAESADTAEGRFAHRVADKPGGKLPARPLVVTIDATCAVAPDAETAPASASRPQVPHATVRPPRAGCCGAEPAPSSSVVIAFAVLALLLGRRRPSA